MLGQLKCLGVEMSREQIVLEMRERIGIVGTVIELAEAGGDFGKEPHQILASKFLHRSPVKKSHVGSLDVGNGGDDSPKDRRKLRSRRGGANEIM